MRLTLGTKLLAALLPLVLLPTAALAWLSAQRFRADKETYLLDLAQRTAALLAREAEARLGKLQAALTGSAAASTHGDAVTLPTELVGVRLYAVVGAGGKPAAGPDAGPATRPETKPETKPEAKVEALLASAGAVGDAPPADAVLARLVGRAAAGELAVARLKGGTLLVAALREDRLAVGYATPQALLDPAARAAAGSFVPTLLFADDEGASADDREDSLVRAAREADGPRVRALGYAAPDGEERLGAYARSDRAGLAAIVSLPHAEVDAAARRLVVETGFLALGVALASIGAALLLARGLAGPLRGMAALAQRIAHGELGARLALRRRDELGELADALDTMSATLAAREESLAKARALAMTSARRDSLAELGHGIAQQFNGPLARIAAAAQMAGARLEEAHPARHSLEAIAKATRQCHELVVQLGTLARGDAAAAAGAGGKGDDDAGVLQETLRALRPELEASGVGLDETILPLVGRSALPALELRMVVQALVRNAHEALGPGGRVAVDLMSDAAGLELRVTDDGPGVAPEALARLFEPFFTTKKGGAGLGLSVARSVVEGRGGTLVHERPPGGRGAAFVVRVPLAPAADAAAAASDA
ncbi:MAG TPA: HAMP domain-containing sensor histidine kinase [Myxococcota bacterium]|nr:HAMP domain-containing sensor histidine kinase [Myxococcota bacterium]